MRKTVAVLSLTTLGFASSTAYLAYLLHARPDDVGSVDASTTSAAAGGTADQARASASARAAHPDAPAGTGARPDTTESGKMGAATAGAASKPDPAADMINTFARQFLARYDDSAQRIGLLDETRTTLRRQYDTLRKKLELGDAEYEQLLTQLAEEQLDMQSRYMRCRLDPKCDAGNPAPGGPPGDHSQELLALLGARGLEELKGYRATLSERDTVAQLRGRLPDANPLAEPLAERLVAALGDERDRYQREISAAGGQVSGWGTNLGMLFYQNDGGTPEQQLADAARYSQRMRQRAGTVLTAAQLAAFVQLQDELLAQMAASLGLTRRP